MCIEREIRERNYKYTVPFKLYRPIYKWVQICFSDSQRNKIWFQPHWTCGGFMYKDKMQVLMSFKRLWRVVSWGNTPTNLSANAPCSVSARSCGRRVSFNFAGWECRIGAVRVSDKRLPRMESGHLIAVIVQQTHPWKTTCWCRWIGVAQSILLQNISNSGQYAVCQVSEHPRIRFENQMPDILWDSKRNWYDFCF